MVSPEEKEKIYEIIKKSGNYELAVEFVSSKLIVNPRISIAKLHRELKEFGIYKTDKSPFSKKDIEVIVGEIKSLWRQEAVENAIDAKQRRLREIQYIKTKLHEEGDYKTLATYIKLENSLLNDVGEEPKKPNDNNVSLEDRIRALEIARKQEEIILNKNEATGVYDFVEE